jgi:hypothetical protein
MTTPNIDENNKPDGTPPDDPNKKTNLDSNDPELLAKLVQEKVDQELAEIKKKLDSAYSSRDDALLKLKEKDDAEKAAQRKKLEDEGKFKELYEQQLAEEKAEKEALKRKNVELSRDILIKETLRGLEFRNTAAADVAYQQILGQVIQNDKGDWIHKSGIQIKDFVETFSKDENYSFLFKSKQNSGLGSGNGSPNAPDTTGKSVFKMTQAEVLAAAAAGKLGNGGNPF